MATYRFVDYHMIPILQHIESYKIKVIEMQYLDMHYTITTDAELNTEDFQHLSDGYNLEVL